MRSRLFHHSWFLLTALVQNLLQFLLQLNCIGYLALFGLAICWDSGLPDGLTPVESRNFLHAIPIWTSWREEGASPPPHTHKNLRKSSVTNEEGRALIGQQFLLGRSAWAFSHCQAGGVVWHGRSQYCATLLLVRLRQGGTYATAKLVVKVELSSGMGLLKKHSPHAEEPELPLMLHPSLAHKQPLTLARPMQLTDMPAELLTHIGHSLHTAKDLCSFQQAHSSFR